MINAAANLSWHNKMKEVKIFQTEYKYNRFGFMQTLEIERAFQQIISAQVQPNSKKKKKKKKINNEKQD